MSFDLAIFLAALGITTLEVVETAAVALALYAHSGKHAVFLYAALGTTAVFAPMFVLGALITLLPGVVIKLIGGALLLYFGQRLAKSARRAVLNARNGSAHEEQFERGTMATAFSVGAIEAAEAAIVLVGLLPNDFRSTVSGMGLGIVTVVIAAFALRSQVRKVKQADMKIAVSALLLSFATFWFGEAVVALDDLLLIPWFWPTPRLSTGSRTARPQAAHEEGGPPSAEELLDLVAVDRDGPEVRETSTWKTPPGCAPQRMVETSYRPRMRRPSSNRRSLNTETS